MKDRLLSLTAAMVLTLSTFAASIKTDRTWYLAGEAMKVSVSAENTLVAYAELCDTQGLVAGIVVSLKEGTGQGVIELPSNLHSGYYLLSAYTRGNADVSQQLVAVINPLRKSVDDDIEWVEASVDSGACSVERVELATAAPSALDSRVAANAKLNTLNSTLQPSTELEGHIVLARIKNVRDGHTFIGGEIRPSLSIVGKQIHYFEGKMVNDSTAVFYTFGIHGKRPLVLSAMSYTGVSLPIEMISPFAALLPKQLPHLVFHYNRSEVEARSLDMQRHQMAIAPAKREVKIGDFSDDAAEDGVPLDYEETVFGFKPDLSYNLDEYRQFFTVREVLLEYVNCVKRTKIDDIPRLIVRREQDQYNSTLPTLVLIDGMPVNDIERLLNYDARRIHYINIYANQYTFGNSVYNGILSFVTRSGRLTNYPTDPYMQYLVYEFPE